MAFRSETPDPNVTPRTQAKNKVTHIKELLVGE